MDIKFPSLSLKTKLIAVMGVLLGLTLGAEVVVSLGAQEAIVSTTQKNVKDLASAIQISVQELTSIAPTDRDQLQHYVGKLNTKGLEVSIASSQDLIINSSDPKLIGAALNRDVVRALTTQFHNNPSGPVVVPASKLGLPDEESIVYFIPVEVEDHVLGYVQVIANFSDFDQPLHDYRMRLLAIMKDEIRRLSEMVQSFLHYGQPIEIRPAPTDLRQVVDSVLALSESKLKSQGIEVVEQGGNVPAMLNVDAEKLRLCFVNV